MDHDRPLAVCAAVQWRHEQPSSRRLTCGGAGIQVDWRMGLAGLCCWRWLSGTTTWAAGSGDFVTRTPVSGSTHRAATIEDVRACRRTRLQALERPRSFEIDRGALWLRYEPAGAGPRPTLVPGARRAARSPIAPRCTPRLQTALAAAGGRRPPARAHGRTLTACRCLRWRAAAGTVVWLRLENHPAPLSPSLRLQDEQDLQARPRPLVAVAGHLPRLWPAGAVPGLGPCAAVRRPGVPGLRRLRHLHAGLPDRLHRPGRPLLLAATCRAGTTRRPRCSCSGSPGRASGSCARSARSQRHSRHTIPAGHGLVAVRLAYPILYFLFLSPAAFKLLNLYGLLSVC
jgi:hypothetical protein